MLISVQLEDISKLTVIGSLDHLESILYTSIIAELDVSEYKDKPVIIKGCSNKPVPSNALVLLSQKLKSIAKSIMFGEACSSVPLYKRK
jgi:peptide deformylase